jgi:hypothetical protein
MLLNGTFWTQSQTNSAASTSRTPPRIFRRSSSTLRFCKARLRIWSSSRPTPSPWECAARAGTSTRFSYGDDLRYADLPHYAWQLFEDGLTVHRVGQKLPNPWALYDMAGNVFEWCQDWLGPLPGGSVTDPQGPPSNPIGWKVVRGGAFDFGGPACRSASRNFFGNHPALTDWNLGFRVVLVSSPDVERQLAPTERESSLEAGNIVAAATLSPVAALADVGTPLLSVAKTPASRQNVETPGIEAVTIRPSGRPGKVHLPSRRRKSIPG